MSRKGVSGFNKFVLCWHYGIIYWFCWEEAKKKCNRRQTEDVK